MTSGVAYDATSLAGLAFIALVVLSAVLLFAWWRGSLRERTRIDRVGALAGLALFLCFDLVCFGSYTRLSDAGLGCPDWPGCYATASPVAAAESIAAAEVVAPEGPVTRRKAWIEMIHRYFALALGALIIVLLAAAIAARRERPAAWRWALLTLGWVVLQGVFGALTVTWKLYPAVVTAHLLGGMGLLALLALQVQPALADTSARSAASGAAGGPARIVLAVAGLVLVIQVALGGWVSTNYAVLACTGFPTCNGRWWPVVDWVNGFTLLRELGRRADGQSISMAALVAIQMAHRLFAIVAVLALGGLAWACARGDAPARRRGAIIAGLLLLQVATGVANVTLGWPLASALLHTAG
ncbi:MAG TPA: COX15/CtaA family protein, partial [Burkholderiaceae bacterium]|nr:COX15/CtaA family protein [Burkholderiaceae bacterium]